MDATTTVKAAAQIGGKQDKSFEQTFSSLAYAHHADKAPRLRDYLVGFQLIERDDDANKAAGAFGFKVGDEWFFGPVFFINSEIKGHEILYIEAQDQFVPLKEKWVDFILSRRPHRLGGGSGLASLEGSDYPDFGQLADPPSLGKFAGDKFPRLPKEALDKLLPMMAAAKKGEAVFFGGEPTSSDRLDFAKVAEDFGPFVKQACAVPSFEQFVFDNPAMGYAIEKIASKYPSLSRAYSGMSGLSLEKLASAAVARHRQQKVAADMNFSGNPFDRLTATPGLRFVSPSSAAEWTLKTAEDRDKLLRHGYVVQDTRRSKEVTAAVDVQTPKTLINPEESGLYEVLTDVGTFERLCVVVGPNSGDKAESFSLVFRPGGSGNKAYENISNSLLFCQPIGEDTKSPQMQFREWHDGLGDAELAAGKVYVLVNNRGHGTTAFRVIESLGDKRYQVSFKTYVSRGNSLVRETFTRLPLSVGRESERSTGVTILNLRDKRVGDNAKIRTIGSQMYVPPTYKAVLLDTDEYDDEPDEPIKFGNLASLELLLHEKLASLRVRPVGDEFVIESEKLGEFRGGRDDAAIHLLDRHGVCEKQAAEILDAADKPRKYGLQYGEGFPRDSTIKSAAGYTPGFPDPAMTAVRSGNGSVPAMYSQEQFLPIPGMESGPDPYDDMFRDPNQAVMARAQQAASQGKREFFDLTMLSSLLHMSRHDRMVERHLSSFMHTLDSLGRVLISFYWHGDEFEARYGKSELPELEDTLVSMFDRLGDLILGLKEKSSGQVDGIGSLELANTD